MSFKPEFQIAGDGVNWRGNALRFATREEAEANAQDKAASWSLVLAARVVESTDPVNYRYVNHQLIEVPRA